MVVRRTAELKLLEEQYAEAGNNLVILYGRKGMGKTTLLSEFLEDKLSVYYYEGTECVDQLQLLRMNQQVQRVEDQNDIRKNEIHNNEIYNNEIHNNEVHKNEVLSYPLLFSQFIGRKEDKTIIVLDEFHYIMKNSPSFMETFKLLGDTNNSVMFLLCSSSIRWIENEMISCLGTMASYITAYLKLKEFTFVDFVNRFPKFSVETCIYINAILGGIPEYLDEWKEDRSVQDNIIDLLLNKNSRLFMAPQQFLKLELREPAVYNTILSVMAEGNRKLNDLHAKTGFSRAKISVYLKYLIQLDLVEKLTPLSEEGKENVQKGLYRIKDNFLSFWYRFVFPNLSDLMLRRVYLVYEERVVPYLTEYMGEYFADVCTEFLKLMNMHQRLPEKYLWWDRWYGKNGTIDILAQGETGKILVGKCLWDERKADISDYEALVLLSREAEKNPDYCYLFSKEGFTEKLRSKADEDKSIILVGLDDL
ncbi:MAG: ATP-binding protein [Herbinix sp.]|nr:ATP-binding protein [Herbinix sp.]